MTWGQGDGSTLHVFDTPLGRIGAAICWENLMPALRLALYGQGIEFWCAPTLDLAAPAAAVGHGIGRFGCFLSGDGCYGIATKLPWGMSFPHGIDPTPPFVRVHPTPLYEMAAEGS